jgi:hypothetical protein
LPLSVLLVTAGSSGLIKEISNRFNSWFFPNN